VPADARLLFAAWRLRWAPGKRASTNSVEALQETSALAVAGFERQSGSFLDYPIIYA
jgi:hypothetical protein